jgi:hypothetical protein
MAVTVHYLMQLDSTHDPATQYLWFCGHVDPVSGSLFRTVLLPPSSRRMAPDGTYNAGYNQMELLIHKRLRVFVFCEI